MPNHSRPSWIHRLPWISSVLILTILVVLALNPTWAAQVQSHLTWMIQPIFHDWWVVKEGLEAHVDGLDPLAAAHLPYNYPRILLVLGSGLHLQILPPIISGLALAAICLSALALYLGRGNTANIVIGATALLAPPVWMLVERGNIDSLVLTLVLLGLWGATRKESWVYQLVGVAALLLASLLKFFPAIILIGGLFAWPGLVRRYLLVAVAIFGITLALNPDEPDLILRKTGRGLEASYGWSVAGSRPFILDAANTAYEPAVMRSSFATCLIILLGATVVGFRMRHRVGAILAHDPWQKAGFWAGALVYVGTFALGANWAYRLAFLLLCLPAIVAVLSHQSCRRWAGITLFMIAITLFAPFKLNATAFYLVHASEWILTGLLTFGAVAVLLAPTNEVLKSSSTGS